jgi:hypothetical protein
MSTVEHARGSADERTWESLRRAIASEVAGKPLHRSGTVYVPEDLPELDSVLERYKAEHRPVVVVSADGTERVIDAGEDALRQVIRLGLIVLIAAIAWDTLKRARAGAL